MTRDDKDKAPRSIKDRLRNPPGPICKKHLVEDCEECVEGPIIGAMRCEECNAIHSRMVSIAEVTICRECLLKALRAIDEYWGRLIMPDAPKELSNAPKLEK